MKGYLLPILIVNFCFTLSAQKQWVVEGNANSTDTVATIKVNSTAFAVDVVGLSVYSNPTSGRGLGATLFGGGTALRASSTQFPSIITESLGSFGLHSTGSVGAYFRGSNGIDIMLGASAFRGSGADEGVIRTQLNEPSSDMYLVSNDAVIIDLDENADEEGSFEIHNDTNQPVFRVLENSQVKSGHIEIKGSTYEGVGGDESVIESDKSENGGDLWLVSNDAIVLSLDKNDDEAGHVEVKNGQNSTVASIDEAGNIMITGEMQSADGGSANMLPICYGYIDPNGGLINGSDNVTVSMGSDNYYVVTIANHNFTEANYIVLLNPLGSAPTSPVFWDWTALAGKLRIRCFTQSAPGNPLFNQYISFMVFKP